MPAFEKAMLLAQEKNSREMNTVRIYESLHPYQDGTKDEFVIEYAANVQAFAVAFHPDTRTEANYDFLTFECGDAQLDSVRYSGGRGGSARNFPGLDGNEVLVIPSRKCSVRFESDASNNDWGYKFATWPVDLPAPKKSFEELLVDLKKTGTEHYVYESTHPYDNARDDFTQITMKTAKAMTIVCSSDCSTERNYDYLQFLSGKNGEPYGAEKYTGGLSDSAKVFPGVGSTPPLTIPKESVWFHFYSDRFVANKLLCISISLLESFVSNSIAPLMTGDISSWSLLPIHHHLHCWTNGIWSKVLHSRRTCGCRHFLIPFYNRIRGIRNLSDPWESHLVGFCFLAQPLSA